ncbi:hypothetical protein [Streptomyces sp. NPDC048659]|uniref:hypothetical protein n=1 Tax=Streptomyces sp. NPDC048659 TaxID=3155489 RepID=UPI00342D6AD0
MSARTWLLARLTGAQVPPERAVEELDAFRDEVRAEAVPELDRLRLLLDAQPADLTEAQLDALAAAGNRALNDHYHDDLCHCREWPESCATRGYFPGMWDTGAFDIGLGAVLGLWESMRGDATAGELAALRARVAKLESQSSRVRTDELVPGDRVRHPHDMTCFAVTRVAPDGSASGLLFHNRATDENESGLRVTGTDDSGETVHVDCAPSYLWHMEDATAELVGLRARVAELKAERQSTNAALSEAVESLATARDRIAELEAGLIRLASRMRRGQHWRDGRVVSEQTITQREIRHLVGLPLTPPTEDEYQYCGADLGRTEFPFTCYRRVAHSGPCGPAHDAPAPRPSGGELAKQRHLMDELDHALEALAPRTTPPTCRCDDPGADPYECEADDCTHLVSELNPFGAGARPVNRASAEVTRICPVCDWKTVWQADDGSAEESLHRHMASAHTTAELPTAHPTDARSVL